jgi:hypothetical protein
LKNLPLVLRQELQRETNDKEQQLPVPRQELVQEPPCKMAPKKKSMKRRLVPRQELQRKTDDKQLREPRQGLVQEPPCKKSKKKKR